MILAAIALWALVALVVAGLLWREARKPLTDDDLFYDAADRRLDTRAIEEPPVLEIPRQTRTRRARLVRIDSAQTNGSEAEHPEAALTTDKGAHPSWKSPQA